jgi:hypothetical protein
VGALAAAVHVEMVAGFPGGRLFLDSCYRFDQGGGWRSLLPRRTDLRDALKMLRYYTGFTLAN